jgi:peptide/nickel transport system substrate-binding protein
VLAACQQPTSPIRLSDARSTPLPTLEPRPTQPAIRPAVEGKLSEGSQAAPAGPPKPGGSVVWAVDAGPVTLDPLADGPAALRVWADLTYQSLVMFDENLRLMPGLAEAWANTSPTTWTFKLRQGIRFHDGSELEAEDIRAWHARLTASGSVAPARTWQSQIVSIQPTGRYEMQINLREAYAPLLAQLAGLHGSAIVPRGWAQRAGSTAHTSAVGSGPFKIAEYVSGNHVRYVKHADYWEKGLPYLDEVTLKIVPDEAARVAALRAGEVTYARVGAESARRFRNEKHLNVLSSPGAAQRITVFNTRRAPFDDTRVRQAMSMAVDRQAAIATLLGGEGRLTGPVPSGLGGWGMAPDALPYRRDLTRARQLLGESGHADGFEATVRAATEEPGLLAVASLLAEQVRSLGINLKVEPIDRTSLLRALDTRDFDVVAVGTDFVPDPDDYLMPTPGSRSPLGLAGWESSRYAELVGAARTILDPGQRKLMYDEAVSILLAESPAIWWLAENTVEVVHSSIKGYLPSFTGRFPGLKKAWLDR